MIRATRSFHPPTPPKVPTARLSKRRKNSTTRIPDFVEMLFKAAYKLDKTAFNPVRYQSRIILLVEIKKISHTPTPKDFVEITQQTDCQARHALFASPTTKKLGAILAIGPFWKYIEYHQTELHQPSPSFSEKKDSTYRNTIPPKPVSWMTDYPLFVAHAHPSGLLCLDTPESWQGLIIVRDRLRSINLPAVSDH